MDLDQNIVVVTDKIQLADVQKRAAAGFGDMIKGVVDIKQGIMALGGDLHADAEAVLLERGSGQSDLWGINLYPAEFGGDGWLEFDSMINIRPSQGNRSRSVEDGSIREAIRAVVSKLIHQ